MSGTKIHVLPDIFMQEDIKQENAARKLEGRKPLSGRVNQIKELSYGLHPKADSILLSSGREVDLQAVEELANWVVDQSEKIQEEVFRYLDNPIDDQFFKILALLNLAFVGPVKGTDQPYTLTELMLRSMPADIEDLYELARREHQSKRSEAAVRTVLRSLVKRGQVSYEETTATFSATEEAFHQRGKRLTQTHPAGRSYRKSSTPRK